MVLCYMDEVFKHFVTELLEKVDANTTFRTFKSYLKVEHWVGCHKPIHVRNYHRSNDQNIDRSNVREFGMSGLCALVY